MSHINQSFKKILNEKIHSLMKNYIVNTHSRKIVVQIKRLPTTHNLLPSAHYFDKGTTNGIFYFFHSNFWASIELNCYIISGIYFLYLDMYTNIYVIDLPLSISILFLIFLRSSVILCNFCLGVFILLFLCLPSSAQGF